MTITKLDKYSAKVGDTVTVTGTGFDSGSPLVVFGSQEVTPDATTATTITFTVPESWEGTESLSVWIGTSYATVPAKLAIVVTDQGFGRLTKSMPKLYKPTQNINVKALLKAWGEGDDRLETEVQYVKKQMFAATASGKYLDRLGENVGVTRPPRCNFTDEQMRSLVPLLSYRPKQIRASIYQILETFYGEEMVYAHTHTSKPNVIDATNTFALSDGYYVQFMVNGVSKLVTFNAKDFVDITAATLAEVENAINGQSKSSGLVARVTQNHSTGQWRIMLRTAHPGPANHFSCVGEYLADGTSASALGISTGETFRLDAASAATLYESRSGELTVYLPAFPALSPRSERRTAAFLPRTEDAGKAIAGKHGPYVYDRSGQLAVSSDSGVIDSEGDDETVLLFTLTSGSTAHDGPGWIVFDFGKSTQEVVPFIAKLSGGSLRIDPSYHFQQSRIGQAFRFVRAKAAPQVDTDGFDYGAYLVSAVAARSHLETLLRKLIASGVRPNVIVRYPETKWGDLRVYDAS